MTPNFSSSFRWASRSCRKIKDSVRSDFPSIMPAAPVRIILCSVYPMTNNVLSRAQGKGGEFPSSPCALLQTLLSKSSVYLMCTYNLICYCFRDKVWVGQHCNCLTPWKSKQGDFLPPTTVYMLTFWCLDCWLEWEGHRVGLSDQNLHNPVWRFLFQLLCENAHLKEPPGENPL